MLGWRDGETAGEAWSSRRGDSRFNPHKPIQLEQFIGIIPDDLPLTGIFPIVNSTVMLPLRHNPPKILPLHRVNTQLRQIIRTRVVLFVH